jgi:sec-independent protein translocase protein TatB
MDRLAWEPAVLQRREERPVFNNIGWGEIVVLAIVALFIFGPERLPNVAKDAADGLKKARKALTGVREQVNESLGDDLAHLKDLDLRQYHPKTFIRNQLLSDDEPPVHTGSTAASKVAAATAAATSRDPGTPPPFDSDAT